MCYNVCIRVRLDVCQVAFGFDIMIEWKFTCLPLFASFGDGGFRMS